MRGPRQSRFFLPNDSHRTKLLPTLPPLFSIFSFKSWLDSSRKECILPLPSLQRCGNSFMHVDNAISNAHT